MIEAWIVKEDGCLVNSLCGDHMATWSMIGTLQCLTSFWMSLLCSLSTPWTNQAFYSCSQEHDLRISDLQKGYVCYNLGANRPLLRRHVIFLKDMPFYIASSLLVISQISFLSHFSSFTFSNHLSFIPIHVVLLLCPWPSWFHFNHFVQWMMWSILNHYEDLLGFRNLQINILSQQWNQLPFWTPTKKQVQIITNEMQ